MCLVRTCPKCTKELVWYLRHFCELVLSVGEKFLFVLVELRRSLLLLEVLLSHSVLLLNLTFQVLLLLHYFPLLRLKFLRKESPLILVVLDVAGKAFQRVDYLVFVLLRFLLGLLDLLLQVALLGEGFFKVLLG